MDREKEANINRWIQSFKTTYLRALTDDEVDVIIDSFGGCTKLQRNKFIKEGKKGINNIFHLYSLYKDYKEDLDKDEYNFLVSSILETGKELKTRQKILDNTIYPQDSAISKLEWDKMQYLYIKNLYGFPIENDAKFIKNHQAIYSIIFKTKEEGKEKDLKK